MTYSEKTVKKLLLAKGGNMTAVAKAIKMSRSSLYQKVKRSPALMQVWEDSREALVDLAEDKLMTEVESGNMTAIAYVLNNSPSARARGWKAKVEVDMDLTSNGEPVGVQNNTGLPPVGMMQLMQIVEKVRAGDELPAPSGNGKQNGK